jgi:methylthioribose-1-phosphate isomerase
MRQKILVEPIRWQDGVIRILDQTKLPVEIRHEDCKTVLSVGRAIKKLKVRGAPLIGIAGALGFLLGMHGTKARGRTALLKEAKRLRVYLASSRPTAVNLFWALDRMHDVVAVRAQDPLEKMLEALKKEAEAIIDEDITMCFKMSEYGARLIKDGDRLMTVCNAGALATSGYGTALGVFYRAHEQGKKIKVYACETRPLLQGARLTTWELTRHGVATTLICDNMAADVMRRFAIRGVFVGADRIAANGDFANKIGTYGLAVLARYHKVPFYAVAPFSTFDLTLSTGSKIPIEERDKKEVTSLYFKRPIAGPRTPVFNPAFDVTPHDLVTGIITERGVIRPPFQENIKALYGASVKKS